MPAAGTVGILSSTIPWQQGIISATIAPMIPGISHALSTLITGLFLLASTALLAPYFGIWLDTFNISTLHERTKSKTASLSDIGEVPSPRRGYSELDEMLGRYTEDTRNGKSEE